MSVINTVRKAIVTKCWAEGINDPEEMRAVGFEAIRNLGVMSVAGFKAASTRQTNARTQRKFRRK